MARNITIKVPGKHPQTGELTTFELKGTRVEIEIGGQTVPFLIHGQGIGTALTHIPSGYRIALLGGMVTVRYLNPKDKPSSTMCAQMAIERLVANYGAQAPAGAVQCPACNQRAGSLSSFVSQYSTSAKQHRGQPSQAGPLHRRRNRL